MGQPVFNPTHKHKTKHMKKLIFTLLLVLPLLALSQNQGQHYSNQFVSLSNYGWAAGKYNLKITNKQDCPVNFRVSIGGTHVEVGPIAGNTAMEYLFEAPENCAQKVQVKPLNHCHPGPDMGQVEARCMEGPDLLPLPVKFLKVYIERRTK